MKRKLICFIAIIIISSQPVQGGVTGKIRGTVEAAGSGEPLPGANVLIEKVWINGEQIEYTGPTLGAASDIIQVDVSGTENFVTAEASLIRTGDGNGGFWPVAMPWKEARLVCVMVFTKKPTPGWAGTSIRM